MVLLAALLPFLTVAPDHWTFAFRGGLQDACWRRWWITSRSTSIRTIPRRTSCSPTRIGWRSPFGSGLREGDWFARAMETSRSNATGWFTFFFDALKCAGCTSTEHLRQFGESAAAVQSSVPKRSPAATKVAIDPEKLWRSKDEDDRPLLEYQALRPSGAWPDFTWENQDR